MRRRRLRNRHDASQPQVAHARHRRQHPAKLLGLHAAFRFFAVDVDFDENVQLVHRHRTLVVQSPRNLHAINALHPVKVLGDHPRLVRLERPDEMPREAHLRMVRPEPVHLVAAFLRVVFAKVPLAALGDRKHRLGGERLRDRQKFRPGAPAPRFGFEPGLHIGVARLDARQIKFRCHAVRHCLFLY